MHAVFRPTFGRVLTVVIAAICGVTAVVIAVGGNLADLLRFAPWLALLVGGCWATFWRPCVEVSDGGVRLVNVTRTIDVPWPAITGIETRWALTLLTAYGKFTAWAAPAPGRGPMRKATRVDAEPCSGVPVGADVGAAPDDQPGGPPARPPRSCGSTGSGCAPPVTSTTPCSSTSGCPCAGTSGRWPAGRCSLRSASSGSWRSA